MWSKSSSHGCFLPQNATADDDVTKGIRPNSAAIERPWNPFLERTRSKTENDGRRCSSRHSTVHGCESWIKYRRHVRKFDQFYSIWNAFGHVAKSSGRTGMEVFGQCRMGRIETMMIRTQTSIALGWSLSQNARKPNKKIHSTALTTTKMWRGQMKRFRDNLQAHTKAW